MASDALIIGGTLGVIWSLVRDVPLGEVARWQPSFVERTALSRDLSAERTRGVKSVLASIIGFAQKAAS